MQRLYISHWNVDWHIDASDGWGTGRHPGHRCPHRDERRLVRAA